MAILRFVWGFLVMALRNDDQIPIERFRLGKLRSYEVLVDKFDQIEVVAMTIGTDLAFAMACLPVALALTVTLATVPIQAWNIKGSFLSLTYVCYLAGLYFSVRAFRSRGSLKKFMQAIRDAQEAPLGEKGSEIGPTELQGLPSEEESGSGGKHKS
jgi:hypothetical protein